MSTDEAEALSGGASGDGTGRNPGTTHAGAEVGTADSAQPKSQRDGTSTPVMAQVVSRANMQLAYSRVMRNRGAPGVDGMRCEDLKAWLAVNWEHTKRALLEGRYQPQSVRRVDIPKPQGGVRTLGVPTVVDRLIQQAGYSGRP